MTEFFKKIGARFRDRNIAQKCKARIALASQSRPNEFRLEQR